MRAFVHKLIATVLLLSLPLQGLSAALMPFHCVSDEQHEEVTVNTPHQLQTVMLDHDGNSTSGVQPDGDPSNKEGGHFCCNHVYTGAPSVAVLTAPDTPFVLVNQISTVPPLFFPEQFLRPPRS
jgi:hypothetical protein